MYINYLLVEVLQIYHLRGKVFQINLLSSDVSYTNHMNHEEYMYHLSEVVIHNISGEMM